MTRFLLTLLVALSVADGALAWCDFNEYSDADTDGDFDPPLPYARVWDVEIEDDIAGWDNFIGCNQVLSNNPADVNYYRDVVEFVVESAFQAWARDGRVPYKLGIIGWSATATQNAIDRRNTISVAAMGGGSTAGVTIETDGEHADIVFDTDSAGACLNTAASPLNGQGSGFYRLMRHEVSHVIGLGHICFQGGHACTGRIPENQCFTPQPLSGQGAWMTDLPHGEDIEGLQKIHRGDTVNQGSAHLDGDYVTPNSLLPRRQIHLRRKWIDLTTNTFVDSSTITSGLYSVYLPRIDCRRGTGITDCAMVRAWTENAVRFNTVDATCSGCTPSFGTTFTLHPISTRRSPDVAISHTPTEDRAVFVVAQTEPSDPITCSTSYQCALGDSCFQGTCSTPCSDASDCDPDESCNASSRCTTSENFHRGTSFHTISNLGGTPTLTAQGELDPSTDDDITVYAPRITFVRSFGGSCLRGAACSGGQTLTSGRFLAMTVFRDRTPRLWISNVGGTSFSGLTEVVSGQPSFLDREIHEGFDIACPNHSSVSGDPNDRFCRVVFDPYEEPDQTVNGTLMECVIRLQSSGWPSFNLSFSVDDCGPSSGFGATRGGHAVALSDYGSDAATGWQRTNPAWLVSTSEPDPLERISKMPHEYSNAAQLSKPEEVFRLGLVARDEPSECEQPCEQALHLPTSPIAPEQSPILPSPTGWA